MSEGDNKNLIQQIREKMRLRKGLQITETVVDSGMVPDTTTPQDSGTIVNNVDGIRRTSGKTPADSSETIDPSGSTGSEQDEPIIGEPIDGTTKTKPDTSKNLGKKEVDKLESDNLNPDTIQAETPGGPAKKDTPRTDEYGNPVEELERKKKSNEKGLDGLGNRIAGARGKFDNGVQNFKDKYSVRKNATDAATQALKKAAIQFAKKYLSKAFWSVAWPYVLVAAAAGVALAIIVILIAMYLGKSNQSPNQYGKSAAQQVDPVIDKPWIQKVLQLTGDEEITKAMSESFLNNLKIEISNTKDQLKDNPSALKKIDDLLAKIDKTKTATGTDKTKLAKEIKDGVTELVSILYSVAPFSTSIKTAYPIDPGLTTFNTFNKAPHIGTPVFPCGKDKNGQVIRSCNKIDKHPARTFMYTMANASPDFDPKDPTKTKQKLFDNPTNNCDAVDITVGNDVAVHAVFGGKVMQANDKNNTKTSNMWIEYTDKDGTKYTAVYGHMKQDINKDASVTAGEKIGTTGEQHLHFELAIKGPQDSSKYGKCVVVTPAEATTIHNQNNEKIGHFLYNKMLKALNQPTIK